MTLIAILALKSAESIYASQKGGRIRKVAFAVLLSTTIGLGSSGFSCSSAEASAPVAAASATQTPEEIAAAAKAAEVAKEAERAEVQKNAEAFFNRKTKSQADKALLYLQKYRPDLAIQVYARALIKATKKDLSKKENRQTVARILTCMGRSFKLDENEYPASLLYKTARKYDPEDVINKAFLLESLIPSAQFEEATKVKKELDALKTEDPTVLRALANQALFQEDYDACEAYLARAVKAKNDPFKYVTYRSIAQCRIRQGIGKDVPELFKQSAEAAESPYEKELAYGSTALASAKAADADEHFQRASRMLPDDIAWQSGRAQALCLMPEKQKESFEQGLQAIQKKRLTNRSMTLMANALNAHGQPKDADACIDRLMAMKPWSWHPYLAKGRMIRVRGDNVGARKVLEKALALNPKSGGTSMEIVAAYHCEGKNVEALTVAKKKLVDCPRFPQLWIKRGSIGVALKDYADAKMSFDKALKLMPPADTLNVVWKNEAAACHSGLGTIAFSEGDRETAVKEARLFNEYKFVPDLPGWLKLINIRPGRVSFDVKSKKEKEAAEHTVLADMLLEYRLLNDCVAEYAKAVELNPSDVDLHSYYLNALVENNNWIEAAKEDVVLASKIVGRASDSVAKLATNKDAKKDAKKEAKTEIQEQKDGQGR